MKDAKGRPLKAGDRVLIPATVIDVSPDPNYGNITVGGILPRPPDGAKERFRLNSAQMIRAERGDSNTEFFTMTDTPPPENESDPK